MPSENNANPERGEPVADRVARQVREAIDTGQYPPGAMLPGERTLADTYSASVPSVRLGLAMLSAQGRVETAHGRGTVVKAPPVPRYLIEFNPADPLHGLSFVTDPKPLRGAADQRTAHTLGVPVREFVHIRVQGAIHESGALVSVVRILPHCSLDGIEHYPDPVGPREPIIKTLTAARGPLTHTDRHGAAIPTTHDRESLRTDPGALVCTATALTQAAGGQGLMLETLHYNPAETEITTRRN